MKPNLNLPYRQADSTPSPATDDQAMNSIHAMKTIAPTSVPTGTPRPLLLDVRTPAEFTEINVPGSVSMQLHALEPAKVRALLAGKSACYIFCRYGGRATQAAEKLEAAGLEHLFVVEGGVEAWSAAGLPVNRGPATMSLERQVRLAAGFLVLLGAGLGFFFNPAWLALSAFVGGGLMFSGFTNTCGMGMVLARMPWNNGQPDGRTR